MPFPDEAILGINFFSALVNSFPNHSWPSATRDVWKWINLCWEKVDSSNCLIRKRYIVCEKTKKNVDFNTCKSRQTRPANTRKSILLARYTHNFEWKVAIANMFYNRSRFLAGYTPNFAATIIMMAYTSDTCS